METIRDIQRALIRLRSQERFDLRRWLRDLDGPETLEHLVGEPAVAYAASDPPFMTLEEYFEFESKSELRHEFVNGIVFAMSGPSVPHERIRNRLVLAISGHMRGRPCEVFSSGMKLVIRQAETEISYYPDLMVDCRRDAWDTGFVRYPKLVMEILSPSTQHTDRREKLQNYRLVDSVEEYVLVAQHEHKMIFYRRADGWRQEVCAGQEAEVEFRSLGLVLPLAEVYDDILAS